MSIEAQDATPSEETASAQPSATTLALKKVTDNLAEFDAVEAGLQDLERKYKGVVYPVGTPKGLDEAKKARAAIREPRYAIQNAVTEAKRPLEAMKKALAARGEQIIARIEPLEDFIDAQIKGREKEIEDEKEAIRQREQEAAAKVTAAIQAMHEAMADAIGQPVEVIDSKLEQVGAVVVDLDTFGDRTGEAEQTKTRALEALKNLREQRVAFDAQQAEAARLAAEQAEREEKSAKERKEREEQDERDRQARKAQQDKEDFDRRARLDQEEKDLKARRDAQQKEDDERRMLNQELEGLQHQVVIARAGRAPYFEGNRADEMPRLIEQTEVFNFDHFPENMRGMAETIKASTLTTLRAIHQEFIARDASLAAEQAERDRKDREAEELRQKRAKWRDLIDAVKGTPELSVTVQDIDKSIRLIGDMDMTEENFGEYLEEAVEVADKAMQELEAKRTAAVEREEQARQQEEERQRQAAADAAAEKMRDAAPALLAVVGLWATFMRENYSRDDMPDLWDSTESVIQLAS